MSAPADTAQITGTYCPHCHLLVQDGVDAPWPARPARCPHCELLIGAGRSRSSPSGQPGARGTAAGVFSRRAKRHEDDEAASAAVAEASTADEVLEAIRQAALAVGERPERLLMLDYQQLAAGDPGIPPLSNVFAIFGNWKTARRRAR